MEKLFSFAEMAAIIGIKESELISIAYEDGLIDKDGRPTAYAIKNGILVTEEEIKPALKICK